MTPDLQKRLPGHGGPARAAEAPATRRATRRAFTLIELLLVLAVISLILALIVPAVSSVQRSLGVTRSGQMIEARLNLARQLAVTRNRAVEVRFYSTPAGGGAGGSYRSLQIYLCSEKGGSPQAIDKVDTIPDLINIATMAGYSTLLEFPAHTGTQKVPSLGAGDFAYKAFRFVSSGGTDLDPNGPGGTAAQTWFLTLSPINDPPSAARPPKNYYTVQVNPGTGAVTNFRP